MPAYVEAEGLELQTARGPLTVDVAFGGAFYASLEAAQAGLGLGSPTSPR